MHSGRAPYCLPPSCCRPGWSCVNTLSVCRVAVPEGISSSQRRQQKLALPGGGRTQNRTHTPTTHSTCMRINLCATFWISTGSSSCSQANSADNHREYTTQYAQVSKQQYVCFQRFSEHMSSVSACLCVCVVCACSALLCTRELMGNKRESALATDVSDVRF